jgi:hypothetical protein
VFDPDADKLLSLAEGGSAGTRRVTRVTATSMDIRDDAGIRTLALRDAAGRDSP